VGSWATVLLFCIATVTADATLAWVYRRIDPPPDFRRVERMYRRPSDSYHHGLAPNVDVVGVWGDRRYPLRTNSLGFKDTSCRTIPPRAEGPRLLFIGDSFAEGVGFSFEDTFVGRIAALLAPQGVEVLNAAAVSYAPSIYYRKVKYLLDDVGLDFAELVVFLDIADVRDEAEVYRLDADDNVVATAEFPPLWLGDVPDPTPSLVAWLVDHSIVARAARMLWRSARAAALRRATCPGTDIDPLAAVTNVRAAMWTLDDAAFDDYGARGLTRARDSMDRLLAVLTDYGRTMTIVVYPWPDQIVRGDRDSKQVTAWRTWAAERGVRFIDLFPEFIGEGDPADVIARDFIPCDVHFSLEGHRRVAHAFLREYGVIP